MPTLAAETLLAIGLRKIFWVGNLPKPGTETTDQDLNGGESSFKPNSETSWDAFEDVIRKQSSGLLKIALPTQKKDWKWQCR